MGAIEIRETDLGSKKRTRKAIRRIQDKKAEAFVKELDAVVDNVVATAKRLCPVDTGTLQRSIRKIRTWEQPTSSYHIKAKDVTLDFQIIAGGAPYYNPKYNKMVDYAQAVHDGTYNRPPTPFLTDAVDMHQAELDEALNRFVKKIEEEWARD